MTTLKESCLYSRSWGNDSNGEASSIASWASSRQVALRMPQREWPAATTATLPLRPDIVLGTRSRGIKSALTPGGPLRGRQNIRNPRAAGQAAGRILPPFRRLATITDCDNRLSQWTITTRYRGSARRSGGLPFGACSPSPTSPPLDGTRHAYVEWSAARRPTSSPCPLWPRRPPARRPPTGCAGCCAPRRPRACRARS